MAEEYLAQVRNQYEALPYPHRDPQTELSQFILPLAQQLPLINYYCYGGRKDFSKPFRILVAGAGTGDSAIAQAEQMLEFGHRVTYLDISLASMDIAKKRAELRKLTNIDFVHASILDIPKLGLEKFDFIDCAGVLHHLADPVAGLKALESVLKEEGHMHIMVYARYGRFGLYVMQDVLRRLNKDAKDIEEEMDNAVKLLNHVPGDHWYLHSTPIVLNELKMGPAGIYDALLHRQDRAYTVPEVYDYLASCGLSPIRFFGDHPQFGHALYDPSIYFSEQRLKDKVNAMPEAKRQELAELLYSRMCMHNFYATRHKTKIPDAADLDFVPFFFTAAAKEVVSIKPAIYDAIKETKGDLCNFAVFDKQVVFRKNPLMLPVLRYLDGMRTTGEIIRLVMENKDYQRLSPTEEGLIAALQQILDIFGAHDMFFLRHQSIPPFTPGVELQDRMKARRKAGA